MLEKQIQSGLQIGWTYENCGLVLKWCIASWHRCPSLLCLATALMFHNGMKARLISLQPQRCKLLLDCLTTTQEHHSLVLRKQLFEMWSKVIFFLPPTKETVVGNEITKKWSKQGKIRATVAMDASHERFAVRSSLVESVNYICPHSEVCNSYLYSRQQRLLEVFFRFPVLNLMTFRCVTSTSSVVLLLGNYGKHSP